MMVDGIVTTQEEKKKRQDRPIDRQTDRRRDGDTNAKTNNDACLTLARVVAQTLEYVYLSSTLAVYSEGLTDRQDKLRSDSRMTLACAVDCCDGRREGCGPRTYVSPLGKFLENYFRNFSPEHACLMKSMMNGMSSVSLCARS